MGARSHEPYAFDFVVGEDLDMTSLFQKWTSRHRSMHHAAASGSNRVSDWDVELQSDRDGPFEVRPRVCFCGACRKETLHQRAIAPRTFLGLSAVVLAGCWGPALALGWLVAPWAGAVTAILLMGLSRRFVFPWVHKRFPWACIRCRPSAAGSTEGFEPHRDPAAA